MTLNEILQLMPKNKTIVDNIIRAYHIINNPKYEKIICTISGGSDSDITLDICALCDTDNKIDYVWLDTGLEYQATKDHLLYLEDKYNITFKRVKADKPIPTCCKNMGEPFLTKRISEMINRLQNNNFEWEDESYDVLIQKYPHCVSALKWWCNEYPANAKGQESQFNIAYKRHLKEFLLAHPPTFKISAKCCNYAKKNPVHKLSKGYDLNIYGVRKFEGGTRGTAYKSCFDDNQDIDNYRPLFWYTDSDKLEYEEARNIVHSNCYTQYGLQRTGCAGCPFGRNYQFELAVLEQFEPKLYNGVKNIFKNSYEYTKMFNDFKTGE